MIETTLDIMTKDGAMETFICHPERNGPSPAVFLLMDAHGIREELKDMARRLGTVGYYVLLPNLYYRAGRDTIYGPDVQQEGSAEHTRMRAVRTKMTIPPVMDDIGAMLAFLDQQKEVKRGAVGCHGYCMSGPYALAAAARYPDRIAAAASSGVRIVAVAEYGDIDQVRRRRILPDLRIDASEVDLFVEPTANSIVAAVGNEVREAAYVFVLARFQPIAPDHLHRALVAAVG